MIEKIKDAEVITSYTRWVDAVEVREAKNQEVYLTFSPRFEHIWLKSKKHLADYAAQKPASFGLRSQYALRLYGWAEKYASVGTKRISLKQLRKVLGLESVKRRLVGALLFFGGCHGPYPEYRAAQEEREHATLSLFKLPKTMTIAEKSMLLGI